MIGAALVATALSGSAQQSRDLPAATVTAASITGTVVSDTRPPRPVRRAMITINSSDRSIGRTAVTDDEGVFVVAGLPAGRYTVSASKSGWVTASYGATASGHSGSAISLADQQRVTVSMRMVRGAVITGTIVDAAGQPPSGLTVSVLQYVYAFDAGERRLVHAAGIPLGPDERGAYRIYGLAPGDYYVTVQGDSGYGVPGRDLHLTSDVDVQEAARAIQDGAAGPLTDVRQRAVGLAPVFYPGTASVAQATIVTVGPGEERAGIDFTVQYTPAVHVDGTLSAAGAVVPPGTQVTLIASDPSTASNGFDGLRTTRTGLRGAFSFAEVTPGRYTLAARTAIASPTDTAGAPPRWLWTETDLDVNGEDIKDLAIAMQDSLTVSGIVRFESDTGRPPPANVRVLLQPDQTAAPGVVSAANVKLDADGRFTIAGVTPGRYVFGAFPASAPLAWTLRSAIAAGQDTTQTPADVRQSIDNVVITLSDRVADLSGRVHSDGAPECYVIVFAADRVQWTRQSGRVLATRAASDGAFVFKNVRPGAYLITAAADVEPGEWYDPAFLQRIAPSAIATTIAEGEKKVQDIRAGGG